MFYGQVRETIVSTRRSQPYSARVWLRETSQTHFRNRRMVLAYESRAFDLVMVDAFYHWHNLSVFVIYSTKLSAPPPSPSPPPPPLPLHTPSSLRHHPLLLPLPPHTQISLLVVLCLYLTSYSVVARFKRAREETYAGNYFVCINTSIIHHNTHTPYTRTVYIRTIHSPYTLNPHTHTHTPQTGDEDATVYRITSVHCSHYCPL